jgi:hypothetical protein
MAMMVTIDFIMVMSRFVLISPEPFGMRAVSRTNGVNASFAALRR